MSINLRKIANWTVVGVIAAVSLSTQALAELYINEMLLDPGGAGQDFRDEYIEIRGTAGMSLDDHYLIFVENEDNLAHNGSTGEIENIFALGDSPNTPAIETPYTIGSNGFLTLRQKNNLYAAPAPGTTDLVNVGSGIGWGSDGSSSIRHSGEAGKVSTENSGFTLMLIRNNGDPALNQPFLGLDLDVDNDGLDSVEASQFGWRGAWTIIDAIGVFSEANEAGLGRTYAPINFGPELPGQSIPVLQGGPIFSPRIEPDATYVGLGFEIEYIGRWGDSTGQTAADWHASNLTDNPLSGSTGIPSSVDGTPDYRQSGNPHGTGIDQLVETSQGVPYGTKIVDTLGATNLFYEDGDADFDGDVDGADFLTWQRNLGYGDGIVVGADVSATRADGDANVNRTVDAGDLDVWKARFGVGGSSQAATAAVPEPATLALAAIAALAFLARNKTTGSWQRAAENASAR